eukprot:CAMPEP_0173193798 /NCGR_PEP_ID=MMETSP1141-20130122/14151_1 /TAXON_ID=483371 /ORGANISM="non described non described, Strain CCMP2298" /LENGTH=65 /DNA_ID=CAMNT_0014118159 /DNA_START=171 /DNA_END=368 /DNA_ORIENTATION=-
MSDQVVRARKPKRSGFLKQVNKFSNKFAAYAIPFARYSLMPGLFVYAIYCTEPQPTWLELVNPFY